MALFWGGKLLFFFLEDYFCSVNFCSDKFCLGAAGGWVGNRQDAIVIVIGIVMVIVIVTVI
jgi:hypothetical protein